MSFPRLARFVFVVVCVGLLALAGSADLGAARKKRRAAGDYYGQHVGNGFEPLHFKANLKFHLSRGGAITDFVAMRVRLECGVYESDPYYPYFQFRVHDSMAKVVNVQFPTVNIGAIPRRRLPLGRTFLFDNGMPRYTGGPASVEETGEGTFLRLQGRTVQLGKAPFGLIPQSKHGFKGTLDMVTVKGPPETVGTEKCATRYRVGWEAAKHPKFAN